MACGAQSYQSVNLDIVHHDEKLSAMISWEASNQGLDGNHPNKYFWTVSCRLMSKIVWPVGGKDCSLLRPFSALIILSR